MNGEYLLIIDGSSLLSTQFYGNLPPAVLMAKTPEEKERFFPRIMQTSGGVYTNGIFGFIRYMLKVLRQQKPTHIAVAWDITRDTFRKRMYSEYKANRTETIAPLKDQFALCQDILSRIGVKQFMSMEYEADDYSGSLASAFEKDLPVRILTKDRDYLQLADENTTIWLLQQAQKKADEMFTRYGIRKEMPFVPEKAFPMTPERIVTEYGIEPTSVAELKALQGDASDNIKGVPGIGEKTALALIAHYKTIDALYDAIHKAGTEGEKELAAYLKTELGITKNPIPTLIKEDAEFLVGEHAARLSRDLAKIKRDIPIEESLEDLRVNIDYRELSRILTSLEIKTIALPEAEKEERPKFEIEETDIAGLAQMVKEALGNAEPIGIHRYEATNEPGADVMKAFSDRSAYVYAVARQQKIVKLTASDEAECAEVEKMLRELSEAAPVYAFNAKESWCDILPETVDLRDVSLLDYLLRPLVSTHEPADVLTEWTGEGAPAEPEYLAALALTTGRTLYDRVCEQGMKDLFTDIEQPLMWVLRRMESAGVLVDLPALRSFAAMLRGEMDRQEQTIYEMSGEKFNINSPKQLGGILFDKLEIPYPKKTKKAYSTSADILEPLREDYPIVDAVLRYRQYSKLYSTYAEGLVAYLDPDNRIHTTFRQTVTATGRLSSTDPNLQNIPARTELGRDIRKAFVAKEGCVFVDADYSQIELRLMAHLSGDFMLQSAYHEAADIHRLTASQVFNIPFDKVTPQQRSAAKAVNFGILYGISSFSLSQDLGITRSQAEQYIRDYFARFPGVKRYLDDTVADAKKNGMVRTAYGRIRPIPELSAPEYTRRAFGERVAMNSPIQGTAADIMKIAMLRVDRALRESESNAKILLQVHDELLLEVPEEEAEKVAALVGDAMEHAADLNVPLEVDVHIGKSWLDAK